MDASLLLVGDQQFQRLIDGVREITSLSIESAADPLEAMPLIMAQQPDLLLVQAAHPESLALCQQIKEQNRLAWIYCILVNDQPIVQTYSSSRECFERQTGSASSQGEAAAEEQEHNKQEYNKQEYNKQEHNKQEHSRKVPALTVTSLELARLATLRPTNPPVLDHTQLGQPAQPIASFNLIDLPLPQQELLALETGADAYLYLPQPHTPYSTPYSTPELLQQRLQAQIRVGLRQVQIHRELMRTNDVLSAIALSDPLTSLNNRRAFEWELPRQIQNARDRRIPISLIMLDVDFFKSINDTYGHLTGDQVLKFLAARLSHNLRIYDTPFRYGGEEFVIILSNTDQEEAMIIANRLCQMVSEQPFAIDETLDLTVTISAGTATLTSEDDSKGVSLLQRADQCLLNAKAQGRNRVVGCL